MNEVVIILIEHFIGGKEQAKMMTQEDYTAWEIAMQIL